MTTFTQAALSPAPPPDDGTKVAIPRTAILERARALWQAGEKHKANGLFTSAMSGADPVMVSRALADRYGLTAD